MKTKKPKWTVYHVSANPEQLAKAKRLIDLPKAFRQLIDRVTKSHVCPTCGSLLEDK